MNPYSNAYKYSLEERTNLLKWFVQSCPLWFDRSSEVDVIRLKAFSEETLRFELPLHSPSIASWILRTALRREIHTPQLHLDVSVSRPSSHEVIVARANLTEILEKMGISSNMVDHVVRFAW